MNPLSSVMWAPVKAAHPSRLVLHSWAFWENSQYLVHKLPFCLNEPTGSFSRTKELCLLQHTDTCTHTNTLLLLQGESQVKVQSLSRVHLSSKLIAITTNPGLFVPWEVPFHLLRCHSAFHMGGPSPPNILCHSSSKLFFSQLYMQNPLGSGQGIDWSRI